MHSGLQGKEVEVGDSDWALYQEWQDRKAPDLPQADLVVVHDPQPMGIAARNGSRADAWIWLLHVDSSRPCASLWERLRGQLDTYARVVFTLEAFVPPDVAPRASPASSRRPSIL
jgi:trehalose synthase